MRLRPTGFTLIELLVVIAVMAILALIALPTFQGKMVRDQIIEGTELAKIAKAPIAAMWPGTQQMPKDNAAMGLPAAEKVVSTVVTSLSVEDGAINIVSVRQSHVESSAVIWHRPHEGDRGDYESSVDSGAPSAA